MCMYYMRKCIRISICFLLTDVGSNNSGYYELQAVLTHKGRSSSSGHYVAWVRRKGDDWLMFDDENVTGITSEDVLKLSGGGGFRKLVL